MKLLYVFILSLFLFSCSDTDAGRCVNQGPLCDEYQEDYFKCIRHEYYSTDPYGHTETVYVHIWYKVKDFDNEWTYWDSHSEMYVHYCSLPIINEEEDLGKSLFY